jgi:hypothetical protein
MTQEQVLAHRATQVWTKYSVADLGCKEQRTLDWNDITKECSPRLQNRVSNEHDDVLVE